jgi:multiple sugar transport system permease protein
MTPRRRNFAWSVTRHILLLSGAAFILLPFLWMISTASKPQTEIFTRSIHFIPNTFALWDNFAIAFGKANLWRFLINGAVVTASIFALQVLIALPAAYALAKLRFAGREVLFALVLFCILIPPQATAIPLMPRWSCRSRSRPLAFS